MEKIQTLAEITKSEFKEIEDSDCLYCNGTGRTAFNPDHCKYCGREFIPDLKPNSIQLYKIDDLYTWDKIEKELKNIDSNTKGIIEALFLRSKKGILGNDSVRFFFTSGEFYNLIIKFMKSIKYNYENKVYDVSDILNIYDIDMRSEIDSKIIDNSDLLLLILDKYYLTDNLDKLEFILDKRSKNDDVTWVLTKIPKPMLNKHMIDKSIYINSRVDVSLISERMK